MKSSTVMVPADRRFGAFNWVFFLAGFFIGSLTLVITTGFLKALNAGNIKFYVQKYIILMYCKPRTCLGAIGELLTLRDCGRIEKTWYKGEEDNLVMGRGFLRAMMK